MSELVRKITTRFTLETKNVIDGIEQTKKGMKGLTIQTEEGLKAYQRIFGEIGKPLKKSAEEIEAGIAEVRKIDRAARGAGDSFEKVANDIKRYNSTIGKSITEQKIINAQMRLGEKATDAQRAAIRDLIMEQERLIKANKGTFRAVRNSTAQLQYQLQDIAVMMQGNANPFVILSTQGSQIASLFGAGGAVAGSLIAVAGLAGGLFFTEIMNAKSAIDQLGDSTEALNSIISDTEGETIMLTDEFRELAQWSSSASETVKQLAIHHIMKKNSDSVAVLKESLDDLGGFEDTDDIADYLFGDLAENSPFFLGIVDDLKNSILNLESEVNQANIDDFIYELGRLKVDGAFATDEAAEFTRKAMEMALQLQQGQISLEQFNKEYKKIKDEGGKEWETANSINEMVASLEKQAFTFGMTQEEISIYNASLMGADEETLKHIESIYALIKAKKKLSDEEKEAEKAAKEYEKYLKQARKSEQEHEQFKIDMQKQSLDSLIEIAGQGSEVAKIAFLIKQAIAANEVVVNYTARQSEVPVNPLTGVQDPVALGLLETNKQLALATIAGSTVAGIFHGGGAVPTTRNGNVDQTYLLQGGEYVESRAERREIDKLVKANSQPSANITLQYTIQALDTADIGRVLMKNNQVVYGAVRKAMSRQGKTL